MMGIGPVELLIILVICLGVLVLPALAGAFLVYLNNRVKQTEERIQILENQVSASREVEK